MEVIRIDARISSAQWTWAYVVRDQKNMSQSSRLRCGRTPSRAARWTRRRRCPPARARVRMEAAPAHSARRRGERGGGGRLELGVWVADVDPDRPGEWVRDRDSRAGQRLVGRCLRKVTNARVGGSAVSLLQLQLDGGYSLSAALRRVYMFVRQVQTLVCMCSQPLIVLCSLVLNASEKTVPV